VIAWRPFPREVRLRNYDTDAYTKAYGIDTVLRRARLCPCINPESRRVDPNCSACAGWGFTYPAALEVADVKVQWTANASRVDRRPEGEAEPGDFTITWPSDQPAGQADIFVHPIEEAVTDEVLIKNHLDPGGATMERLRHGYPTAVEDLADASQVYVEGEDWELAADGRTIEWLEGGDAPAGGALYTVRYRFRAEYVISGPLPKARHDGSEKLPWTAQVARYDPAHVQAGKGLGDQT